MENSKLILRRYISLLSEQLDTTRLKKDQVKMACRIIMEKGAHVPDTLTKIRALPGITVVGQKSPVDRNEKGSTVLEIYIKFLPSTARQYKNLISIAKLVKSLPGVKIVRILTVGGREVLYKNKPIVV